jgi:actin
MAWSKRGILTLCYPVKGGGLVNNFDDYEKLLHEAFYNEMRVAPEEHPVAILMSPNAPSAQRSKIVQIMYETFNVPAFLYVCDDVAALYPARDGVVVKSGHSGTVISVVRDGRSVPESVVTLAVGGEAVSARIRETMGAEFGLDTNDLTFELLQEIKVCGSSFRFVFGIMCYLAGEAVLRLPRQLRGIQSGVAQAAKVSRPGDTNREEVCGGGACV